MSLPVNKRMVVFATRTRKMLDISIHPLTIEAKEAIEKYFVEKERQGTLEHLKAWMTFYKLDLTHEIGRQLDFKLLVDLLLRDYKKDNSAVLADSSTMWQLLSTKHIAKSSAWETLYGFIDIDTILEFYDTDTFDWLHRSFLHEVCTMMAVVIWLHELKGLDYTQMLWTPEFGFGYDFGVGAV